MATMRNKLLPVSRTELGVTMKVVDGTKEIQLRVQARSGESWCGNK
jgi:hypothetical protein